MKLRLEQNEKLEAVSLSSLINVTTAIDKIVKESYLSIAKGNRRSTKGLKIYANNFENGSIKFELINKVFESTHPEQLALLTTMLTPENIANVTAAAIKFWSLVNSFFKKGQTPTIQITDSPNAKGVVNNGNGTIIVNNYVFETASKIQQHGKKLLSPIKSGDLARIDFVSENNEIITFDKANSDSFDTSTVIDQKVNSLVANIISFNKDKGTGTLSFVDEKFSESRKHFVILSEGLTKNAIDAMKRPTCKIKCLAEYLVGPKNFKSIVKIHILEIA